MDSPSPTQGHSRNEAAEQLRARIASREAVVGVVGLGYVGIPLALAAVKSGFPVVGVDINAERVERINRGESVLKHVPAQAMSDAIGSRQLSATTDFAALAKADAILICVPTPLTRHREPDLSFVVDTARSLVPYLRKGHLVVLESTTYPGTTTEIMRPILEESGLGSGEDFFIAFSPEREDPGNPHFDTASTPKVVGGDGAAALDVADALYSALVVRTVRVSSTGTAEAVKLTENIFRAVNIALVNELKVVFQTMGIDIWEVIDAARTKPFGFMPFYPGPGLGGHCIPIDPFYLTWKAREFDVNTRFIELAGQINTDMPYHVVGQLAQHLDRVAGKGLVGARILVIGIAYKKNVEDLRESPSLKLIEIMEKRGAHVEFHDSYIPVVTPTREHPEMSGRKSVPLTAEEISSYDAVLIATDHDDVDYPFLVAHARLVVDTRNACARAGTVSDKVVKA